MGFNFSNPEETAFVIPSIVLPTTGKATAPAVEEIPVSRLLPFSPPAPSLTICLAKESSPTIPAPSADKTKSVASGFLTIISFKFFF